MGEEDLDNEGEELGFPFSYYLNQADGESLLSVEEFINENYRIITVAGVFAAIVVYLSELTTSPGRSIVVGMVGSSILFFLSSAIIINNSVIEFTKAYIQEKLIVASFYVGLIYAIILILVALFSAFSSRQEVAIQAVDSYLGLILVIIIILILKAKYTLPIQFDESTK